MYWEWLLTPLKDDLFPERIWSVLFVIRFERGFWSHMANIWERSAQNNPFYWLYYEWSSSHKWSLISPSKSSSSFDTSNSDQHPSFWMSAKLVLRVEWNETVSDLSRSIRHQEILEPQPGNFGSMDCAQYLRKARAPFGQKERGLWGRECLLYG